MTDIGTGRQWRIATKFILLTSSMVLAASCIIVFALVLDEIDNSYEDLLNRGRITASVLASNSEYAVYTEDMQSLQNIVDVVSKDPAIVYAAVLDDAGRPLLQKTQRLEIVVPAIRNIQGIRALEQINHADVTLGEDRFIDLLAPVMTSMQSGFDDDAVVDMPEQTIIGYIQLGVDRQSIRHRVDEFLWSSVLLLLPLLMVGFVLTYWLTKRITAPLHQLTHVTQEIATGKLDHQVQITASDEIADLSVSFNRMLGRLRNARHEVEQRSMELQQANERLMDEIHERKQVEEELLKARKLESIGVLAGGIAHDFNNLLTAIIGNLALAKFSVTGDDRLIEIIEAAEKAGHRAKDLTQQLLTFARGGAPVRKAASIRELVQETTRFALRGSSNRCDVQVVDDLWPVEIDKGQISQVLNNLVLNAAQAMAEGGVITVRCDNLELDDGSEYPLPGGRYISIAITDRGCGIPSDILSKIFDPYFTTKETGSGLGLASAYSIIKKHDGLMTVDSTVGQGTTLTVFLPATDKPVDDEQQGQRIVRGSGRILVMDDEADVRDALCSILSMLGYQVAAAEHGEAAVDLYADAYVSDSPFDLVILDLTIAGGMGGEETMKRLLQLDPKVKAIVSSGYSTSPIMASFRDYGFSGVVPKPYVIEELSLTVHQVLCQDTAV